MIFYTTDQLSKKISCTKVHIFRVQLSKVQLFSCRESSSVPTNQIIIFPLYLPFYQLSADLWKLKDYLKKRQRAAELPCTMHSSLSVLLCCLPRRIATKTKPVWFYRMHTNGFSAEKVNARRAAS